MKKKIIIILLIICLIIFGFSVYKIVIWKLDNNKTEEIIEDIKKDVVIEDPLEDDEEHEFKQIDFDTLKKKNKDTVGWITVKGTDANYPFVQSKDNAYYLNKSFDKTYSDAGWIFLDYRNDINNLGKNTIIYGHNRFDYSMFGSLKLTLNDDWFHTPSNHIIEMNTEKYDSFWQIFSVYTIKTEDYYITTDFKDNNEYSKFINTLVKRSVHKFNLTPSIEDKILTLSTCHGSSKKMVIHAKLIKKVDK